MQIKVNKACLFKKAVTNTLLDMAMTQVPLWKGNSGL
jgi:hypothetical protein